MKLKNIVITGALGQDGILLSKILLKKKFKVFGIIKKNHFRKTFVKGVKYTNIDLLSFKKISQFLDKINPFCVVHLGASNPNYLEVKKNFYKDNINITKNLIDYFKKKNFGNKLILVGSSQMYNNNKKINIYSKFKPINSYSKFREDSYKYMLKIKKKFDLNMVMAILFNHDSIYRSKKFLLPRLIDKIKKKKFDEVDSIYQENISGDYSHAEDICMGLYKLIITKKNPDKLILSSNKKTYVNNLIKFLLSLNNSKKIFLIKNKKNQSTPIGDNSYAKKLLKWKIKKNIFIAARELNKIRF